jgi:sec-independent protein translocase protein TatB
VFNVGGGEVLVILLVALIVLGPDKLPDAARKVGNVVAEIRRMSAGFQNEMRAAMEDVSRPEPPKPSLEAVTDEDEQVRGASNDNGPDSRASDDPAA